MSSSSPEPLVVLEASRMGKRNGVDKSASGMLNSRSSSPRPSAAAASAAKAGPALQSIQRAIDPPRRLASAGPAHGANTSANTSANTLPPPPPTAAKAAAAGRGPAALSDTGATSNAGAPRRSVRAGRRRRWLLLLLVVPTVALAVLLVFQSQHRLFSGTSDTLVPQPAGTKELLERIAAPGLVESAGGTIQLSFSVPGVIAQVTAQEGDSVHAGEVVARLDDSQQRAEVAAARAALEAAQIAAERQPGDLDQRLEAARQQMEQLRAAWTDLKNGTRSEAIAAQQAGVKAAELEYHRLQDDAERCQGVAGVSVQQQADARQVAARAEQQLAAEQARLEQFRNGATAPALQAAEAAFLAAQAEYQRQSQNRKFELALSVAAVAARQADLAVAQAELAKTVLRTPVNGVVLWQTLHGGESVGVTPPQSVLTVADMQQLQVRAEIDEADFPGVFPGQTVQIVCPAYPEQTFSGRVIRLDRSAGQKRFLTGQPGERLDVRVVEAVIQISDSERFVLQQRVTAFFLPQKSPVAAAPR